MRWGIIFREAQMQTQTISMAKDLLEKKYMHSSGIVKQFI